MQIFEYIFCRFLNDAAWTPARFDGFQAVVPCRLNASTPTDAVTRQRLGCLVWPGGRGVAFVWEWRRLIYCVRCQAPLPSPPGHRGKFNSPCQVLVKQAGRLRWPASGASGRYGRSSSRCCTDGGQPATVPQSDRFMLGLLHQPACGGMRSVAFLRLYRGAKPTGHVPIQRRHQAPVGLEVSKPIFGWSRTVIVNFAGQ